MDIGELELNQCVPYFVENQVSIRFSHGDILYSNILNVPIISHVKYNSTSDHLNITSGSIICKINDSKDNLSCTDCDSLLPKVSGSLTISIRRLIPCRMHILNHSVLVLYYEPSIQIQCNDDEAIVGDCYLTEDGQVILISSDNSFVYSIRDSSILIMDEYIQCVSNDSGCIRIENYSDQRNLLHSIVYCFYRIIQIQQQASIQNSSFFSAFSNSFVLFRGEIELYKKSQALFSWKPRIIVVNDLGTIILKANSKVKLILHLADLSISNEYTKILQEKNTSTKDRILWINAKKEYHGIKRLAEDKEGKKDTKMLFRFSDKNALMHFFRCICNIVPEEHRNCFEYIHHTYSTVQRSSVTVEDEVVSVCQYAQQLLQEGSESPSTPTKQWSPIIEQRGRELYELAMRLPAVLENPQILTQFLYTLNSTGITLQIWDLVICQFFPLLADTSQSDCIFQILCDIRNKEKKKENEEGKIVELLREKYLQLNSSLRHRRYSLYEKERDWKSVVISFDVFEEYIRYFEKTVDRSVTKGNALSNIFDKYKESIQFGNAFSISNDIVIAAGNVIETNAKSTAYLYVTNRFIVLVNMNDLLIIPLMAIQSCSTVNKSLHLVCTKFTTLPETSRFRTLLKLPSGNESKEKECILSLKFINKFLKREDYTSFTFISTCLQELLRFYSTNKNQPSKYLTSVFLSSSLTAERSNQLHYMMLNFFRFHALLLQTGAVPSLTSQPVVQPAIQSFLSIISTSEPDRDFERFDLILCKRELLLFFMLMNQISQVIKQINSIIMFEIPGISFFFFFCLNYIGLTNHIYLLFPFTLFCVLAAWYFNYFDKSRMEGTTLQEALETRQIEKKHQAGKGIKNKFNSYMTSLSKFYSNVTKVNEILLKLRSLITWVDVDKTRIAIFLCLTVIALFYFIPNNIVLLVVTNFLFTKRWRDPDPPLKKYLRHFWNSVPLPAFSREQAALEELYND